MAQRGSASSLERWSACSIPGLAQWVKDLALLQLRLGSQLQLGSDPWQGTSMCCRVAKNEKKIKVEVRAGGGAASKEGKSRN